MVLYLSAVDATPCEESIQLQDVVAIVAERTEADGRSIIHWFLRHRAGWTLHFNDQFVGANAVTQKLQETLGFSFPGSDTIARSLGGGTLIWSAT